MHNPFRDLDDAALEASLLTGAKGDREEEVNAILRLIVADERQLAIPWGSNNLFNFCRDKLKYSRSTAYRRLAVAKYAEKFPALLSQLLDGKIYLCTAAVVAPHLTVENQDKLLLAIQGMSVVEVQAYLLKRFAPVVVAAPAERAPLDICLNVETQGLAESSVVYDEKSLTAVAASVITPSAAPPRLPRTIIKPIAADISRISVALREGTLAEFRRLKELMPTKSDDEIFAKALTSLCDDVDPIRRHARREKRRAEKAKATRKAETKAAAKKKETRRGSLADRDKAVAESGGQCTYVSPSGERCAARTFIEIDHMIPWALGGSSRFDNFRSMCSAHNKYLGFQTFGPRRMSPKSDQPPFQ